MEATRQIINLSHLDETEARHRFEPLYDLLEETVKPRRLELTNQSGAERLKEQWWKYQFEASALLAACHELPFALVTARVSPWMLWSRVDSQQVFSEQVVVVPTTQFEALAILQSRVHEAWVLFFASSLEDRIRYTPTDCFETFPFPARKLTNDALAASASTYAAFRSELMVKTGKGLTKTYNRFHDPDESSSEVKQLRYLHDEMDRAVLRAYGWDQLADKATCEFLLDYEEEEDDDPTAKKSKKKKPWRYRWPDDFRDEVLARLLELNEQRAKEEKLAGKTAEAKAKSDSAKPRGRKSTKKQEPNLFE
jgi:hypothetical protein